ncbi:MAG: helix-turn-helix domain-containing protein [Thermomicrobiales bacterium]
MKADLERGTRQRRPRADAVRNRERILAAARDVFIDEGPNAPLEAIAARAGVGIATLYRRFPDRRALMHAVVVAGLERAEEEGRLALAEESEPFQALARYLRRILDLRISAVVPALLGEVAMDDDEMIQLRDRSSRPMQALIERAHAAGSLRGDVTFGDIGLLLVRLSRPLPGNFPPALNEALARRHLALLLDALRPPVRDRPDPLPAPALALDDLREITPSAPPG